MYRRRYLESGVNGEVGDEYGAVKGFQIQTPWECHRGGVVSDGCDDGVFQRYSTHLYGSGGAGKTPF